MYKNIKKVLVFMMVAALLTAAVLPSFAAEEYVSRDTFWNWAAGSHGVLKQIINFAGGLGTCSKSEDTYHHASSYFHEGNVDGVVRYRCICEYCGDTFTAYSSDLQQSYETQVQELPAPGCSMDGCLIVSVPMTSGGPVADSGMYVTESNGFYTIIRTAGSYDGYITSAWYECSAPITARYESLSSDMPYFVMNGQKWSGIFVDKPRVAYSKGDDIKFRVDCKVGYLGTGYEVCVYFPHSFRFLVTPGDSELTSSYTVNSRPTSITGDYGIIGDNGQITKVEGNTIVNETNNTVYNPVTNTTSNVTDWQYDYSTRTYNLTLDNGTTSTVTYGDENVTITEIDNSSGDTITNNYTIYYLVDGSGTPGPEVCNHSWTETSTTPATCTVPGSRHLICSLCNETKTEAIPAPGHTWQIKQTVQTQYDETGQLTQQGYTIFECSVCHEQYKSEDGTAPPGGGSGTDPGGDGESLWDKLGSLIGSGLGGLLGLVEAALGKLLDALIALVEMITGKLKEVVEAVLSIFDQVPALFGGFLGFLSAVFPFLPPEIMSLLTLGIAAVVFIGIIKAIRR